MSGLSTTREQWKGKSDRRTSAGGGTTIEEPEGMMEPKSRKQTAVEFLYLCSKGDSRKVE
jgi:hypothetical protein